MSIDKLEQIVIDLHYAARNVELEMGQCKLSIEIRRCATILSNHINPPIPQKHTAKGEQ